MEVYSGTLTGYFGAYFPKVFPLIRDILFILYDFFCISPILTCVTIYIELHFWFRKSDILYLKLK